MEKKKYKVLKELIDKEGKVAKVGDIIFIGSDITVAQLNSCIENGFLEEIKEEKEDWEPERGDDYYIISDTGEVDSYTWNNNDVDNNFKDFGNIFQTKEEATKALEWIKAFKALRDDTKGFKPKNGRGVFWIVRYDVYDGSLRIGVFNPYYRDAWIYSPITFRSKDDAEASLHEHAKEWKIFLGVEG